MSLSDFATRNAVPQRGWTPEAIQTGSELSITTRPYATDASEADLLRDAGYDPEEWAIEGPVTHNRREWQNGSETHSYRFKARRRNADLARVFSEAKAKAERPRKTRSRGRSALVIPLGDLQIGKVGSRGGTEELLERLYSTKEDIMDYAYDLGADAAYLLDAGDIIEGFSNVVAQKYTNDKSLTDQLDIAYNVVQDFAIDLAQIHHDVTIAGVSSNHTRLSEGKSLTHTPNDDYGLHNLRQLKKAFALPGTGLDHIKFFEPEPYRESLTLDVFGHGLGLVHGHQASPKSFSTYWDRQCGGAGPLATADIVVSGHYHHLLLQPHGRSLRTGKSKWWVQTPTMDNGSDWWANIAGSDSDPGIVTFVINEETGFDLQSLQVF